MGKRIKLYRCKGVFLDEPELSWNPTGNIVTEYIFANNKNMAEEIFKNHHNCIYNVHTTISEMRISPGLTIYRNLYNSTIEDNELKLNMESNDKK